VLIFVVFLEGKLHAKFVPLWVVGFFERSNVCESIVTTVLCFASSGPYYGIACDLLFYPTQSKAFESNLLLGKRKV
jgi:hypothetical protein